LLKGSLCCFFGMCFRETKHFWKLKSDPLFFGCNSFVSPGLSGNVGEHQLLRPAQTPKMWEQTQVGTSLEGVWDMKNYHGNDWLTANGRNAKFVLRIHPQKVAPQLNN
jgi:hypothetical protein